ncbi:MAG: hypothetical protein P8K82_03410 [Paracoccaceae bacterium]|nr:hypothetical protein [Paracoccaceae bacterium]
MITILKTAVVSSRRTFLQDSLGAVSLLVILLGGLHLSGLF